MGLLDWWNETINSSVSNKQDNNGIINTGNHNHITIINPPHSMPQKPIKPIPIAPVSSATLYIRRSIDETIDAIIQKQIHQIIVINAQGGLGKSTLINNLSHHYPTLPMVIINKQNQEGITLPKLLMDSEFTTLHNTPLLTQCKERYNSGEALHEIEILDALQKDFGEYGLFVVDTFEKIRGMDIGSMVDFNSESMTPRKDIHHERLKDTIERLFDRLLGRATFVVGGRNDLREINFGIDESKLQELSIEGFNTAHIQEYFEVSNVPLPDTETIAYIHTITNGNALLVSLFPKIYRDYKSWEELDRERIEKVMLEDEEYGLLFYLADRVFSHIDRDLEIYKLAIPRVLNRQIEQILYPNAEVLDNMVTNGLIYKGKGTNKSQFHLHDSFKSSIVADTKRKYQQNFSSHHDNPKIADIHTQMIEYYQTYQLDKTINKDLEICYHTMLLRKDFERDFNKNREEFVDLAFGSLSLNNNEKNNICKKFSELSSRQINELIRIFYEERDTLINMMSSQLYNELKKHSSMGKENVLTNLDILQKIAEQEEFNNDWSIYYLLGYAYGELKEYNKAITTYQKAIEINPKNDDAYNNMGITYGNLKEYDKALTAYQKAIEINPQKDEAYNNMGIAYRNLKEYDKALTAYQKAIEINPKDDSAYNSMGNAYSDLKEYDKALTAYQKAIEINPKYDKAYFNMGIAYDELKEYDKALTAYQKAIEINPKYGSAYTNMFEMQLIRNQDFSLERIFPPHPPLKTPLVGA